MCCDATKALGRGPQTTSRNLLLLPQPPLQFPGESQPPPGRVGRGTCLRCHQDCKKKALETVTTSCTGALKHTSLQKYPPHPILLKLLHVLEVQGNFPSSLPTVSRSGKAAYQTGRMEKLHLFCLFPASPRPTHKMIITNACELGWDQSHGGQPSTSSRPGLQALHYFSQFSIVYFMIFPQL